MQPGRPRSQAGHAGGLGGLALGAAQGLLGGPAQGLLGGPALEAEPLLLGQDPISQEYHMLISL